MNVTRWISIPAGLALAVLLVGCAVTLPSGDVVELPVDESRLSAPASGGVEAEDIPERPASESEREPVQFSLLPLSEGQPERAQDIFAQVSPAVAYVETPNSTGSAVLVEHGYLISAAHVVWPYESVRVVFSDGTEIKDLPVAGWDLMADVSLLGPLDMEEIYITPLAFADGTELPIGSEVYLIGYPAEFEEYPQPALGRGLLSRLREWNTTGISMFQVDADVSGGQSGGAMVSEHGDLVGITNYRFTDSNSPMVTSSTDVVPVLTDMLMREPETLASRRPLEHESGFVYEGMLEDNLAFDYFLLIADAGDEIDLIVEGVGNPIVTLISMDGEVQQSSAPRAEQMNGMATTVYQRGLYVAAVTQQSDNRNPYTLTSSHSLFAVDDPDDGRQLQLGDTYVGSIDNPADGDDFTINLREGDRIVVQAEALAVDPLILITYDSPARVDVVVDDDSGPTGLFGLNARAVFEAPEDGEYTILVADANNTAIGGYIVTVSEGNASEPLTEIATSRELYLTSGGTRARYESTSFPFTMLYPSGYETSDACGEGVAACFTSGTQVLGIFEGSPTELAPSERDADRILDNLRGYLKSSFSDMEVLARRTITTHQGLNGRIESMSMRGGSAYIAYFVFYGEDIGTFLASFTAELGADSNLNLLEESIDRLFASFHVYDEDKLAEDVAYYLEQSMHSAAKREYASALSNLDFALKLNEDLEEAYALRAAIHWSMQNYDLAMADFAAALALDPDNIDWIVSIAYLHWQQGEYGQALARTEEIIELRPDYQGNYNSRSLFRASAGDYEGALAELVQFEQMVEDGLPPSVLDTRAYVHLKFGALEKALADYQDVLADDFQTAYSLLGAGVTLARLDRMNEAQPLLEYGLEKFEDDEYEVVDPQLAELLNWAEETIEVGAKQ